MSRLGNLRHTTFVEIDRFQNEQQIQHHKMSYCHASSNPKEYEWFCFARVFILRRFMAEYGSVPCTISSVEVFWREVLHLKLFHCPRSSVLILRALTHLSAVQSHRLLPLRIC